MIVKLNDFARQPPPPDPPAPAPNSPGSSPALWGHTQVFRCFFFSGPVPNQPSSSLCLSLSNSLWRNDSIVVLAAGLHPVDRGCLSSTHTYTHTVVYTQTHLRAAVVEKYRVYFTCIVQDTLQPRSNDVWKFSIYRMNESVLLLQQLPLFWDLWC